MRPLFNIQFHFYTDGRHCPTVIKEARHDTSSLQLSVLVFDPLILSTQLAGSTQMGDDFGPRLRLSNGMGGP